MNAERTRDRTTAARSRGRQPSASRHSPRSSKPRRRSAAATACWAAQSFKGSVGLVGSWLPYSLDKTRIAGADPAVVRACRRKTEIAVRSSADVISVRVVLPVILPEADLADVEAAALRERPKAATRTSLFPGCHDKLIRGRFAHPLCRRRPAPTRSRDCPVFEQDRRVEPMGATTTP